jgi:hypothetical protein
VLLQLQDNGTSSGSLVITLSRWPGSLEGAMLAAPRSRFRGLLALCAGHALSLGLFPPVRPRISADDAAACAHHAPVPARDLATGPRSRLVALPATHVERPHAVGAHVAEGHSRPHLRWLSCAHGGETRRTTCSAACDVRTERRRAPRPPPRPVQACAQCGTSTMDRKRQGWVYAGRSEDRSPIGWVYREYTRPRSASIAISSSGRSAGHGAGPGRGMIGRTALARAKRNPSPSPSPTASPSHSPQAGTSDRLRVTIDDSPICCEAPPGRRYGRRRRRQPGGPDAVRPDRRPRRRAQARFRGLVLPPACALLFLRMSPERDPDFWE